MGENNVLNVLSENILSFRMKRGLTQTALAEKLGITFQAVSKWETGQSAPDITFLPQLAEIFNVQIDELFGKEPATPQPVAAEPQSSNVDTGARYVIKNVPWGDDGVIRGVVYRGKTLLEKVDKLTQKFVFVYEGAATNVHALCSLECGDVEGSANAGMNITKCGDVGGYAQAGMNITTCGDVTGDVHAGMNITKCGDVTGNARAEMNLTCGDVGGDAHASMSLRCGDIHGNARRG